MRYNIHSKVIKLIKKYKTRNPFAVAENSGIVVNYVPFNKLKGFFTIINKTSYININQDLNDEMQKIVCAHELGHAQLHKDKIINHKTCDIMLFNNESKLENEANFFAADLLIADSDIALYAGLYNFTAPQIANKLSVPVELIYFKTKSMKKRDHQINCDLSADYNFLGK